MPLVKPHSGEEQDAFISRCMGDETMMADFEDNDQRLAICFSQWREVHGGEPPKSAEQIETKALVALDVNPRKGEVEAVFARFDFVDDEGDWALRGAYQDGAPVRISAHEHRSWGERGGLLPVGRGNIKTTDHDVRLVGRFFLNTEHGRDTFETVKEMGELQEWSQGYRVLEEGTITPALRTKGVRRVLKRVYVHEVSPAFKAVGIDTHTVSLKSYTSRLEEERERLEELKAREAELAEQRRHIEHEYYKFARTRRRLGF